MTPGELLEYVSVFIASALNLNYGLGLSVTYSLSRFELFLLLSTGSIFGILLALLLGARIRKFWQSSRFGKKQEPSHKPSLTLQVWQRFGLVGLAMLTIVMGPVPAVAVALIAGIKKELIFMYLSAGKFFWSVVFAFLGYGHLQKVLAAIIQ
jgi:hypothetical protein